MSVNSWSQEVYLSHSSSEDENTETAADEEAAKRSRLEAAAATSLPIW